MIIDINTMQPINRIPHQETFNTLRNRLSDAEFEDAVARINELIDEAGAEVATAGWLPGSDWTGTPFMPIYETAARSNRDVAGQMFGLLVWYTVMQRPERWGTGKFEKDGVPIGSQTYFRLRAL